MWILVILAGSIFGTIIGKAISKYVPLINYGESIGFSPTTVDLIFIKFTIGLQASMTVAGIIGIIIAIIIFKKIR